MTGIRVTRIPEEVTEKHLKVYFSNPNNGGGAVRQIYYPLQDNAAVILFESPSVMSRILKTRHHLDGVDLGVTALPRQIYEKGTMELEKGVSVILSFHRAVIDELQYIGNLKVDFDYNQECYMLKGTWYQLEWALHLLDRTMDSIEGITKYPSKTNEADVNKSDASSGDRGRSKSPEGTTARSVSPEIRSTSPILLSHVPISQEADSLNPVTGAAGYSPGATGYTSESHNTFEDEDHFPWNQNYGRDRQGREAGKTEKRKIVTDDFSSLTNRRGNDRGLKSRGVSKKEIAFSDVKPRPKRPVGHSLTSGLDVSMIGFGDNQLSYSFELNKVLQVMVVKADITKQRTDGIVCPNTPDLSHTYGIASAIARAADRRFLTECQRYVREHGNLGTADVIHTDAGGNLSPHVGFILHTVGPHWREDNSEAVMHYLVCTYLNCFQYSETTLWLKSLSTPLISAGAYGFPLDSCIQAFFDALLIHVTYVERPPHLQEIQLVCFDSDSTGAAIMILQSLLAVDRTQSETAALERYRSGCTKYHFNAKLLNTKQRTSKAKEDNAKEEKKTVTAVPVSSDDDSDREEDNTEDEKKPLIRSSTSIVDQDDKTPKETQYEGNKRFGYGTKERHEEFKGTDVKGVEESIKTENVIKVVDENKDLSDGASDNEDSDTEEQQIKRRSEANRHIYIDANPCEKHAKDVDNAAVSCVKRNLSDDEKEETNITELTDTNLKHVMNGDPASNDARKDKYDPEVKYINPDQTVDGSSCDKNSLQSEFEHEMNATKRNTDDSELQAGKAYDHGEIESEIKKELDMNSSKDEGDEITGVDGSAALGDEITELMSARNVNRETSMEDSMKAFSDTYIKVQTNALGDSDERRQMADGKEDFNESQWSIVPEKISLDEDSDKNYDE